MPGGTQNVTTPAPTASAPGVKQGDSGALAKLGHLSARGSGGGASAGHSGPIWLIVVVVVIVLLITPRLVRSLTRRRRWSRAAGDGPRAQAAWLELLDDLTDYKVAWSASESPRALGSRLTRTLRLSPEAAAALARIVQATERARYARDPADSATLRADTDLVRRAVAANSGRAARWRARLVPPSSLRPVRAGRAARAGRVQLDGPGRAPDGSLVPPRPAPPAPGGRLSPEATGGRQARDPGGQPSRQGRPRRPAPGRLPVPDRTYRSRS